MAVTRVTPVTVVGCARQQSRRHRVTDTGPGGANQVESAGSHWGMIFAAVASLALWLLIRALVSLAF